MAPERWRRSTWGEAVSLEYGKSLRGYLTSSSQREPYCVFGTNGPIGWTDQPLVSGPGVILGRKGAYRGVRYSPVPFFVIDTAYYVVPKVEMDLRWLFYAIQYHKLGEIDDGSPIPSTTRAAVYVRELTVPPMQEQQAIAGVLGALDDKIELNQRINETLDDLVRALFKSWFVDFDPVRAKAGGRVPSGMDAATAKFFPSDFVDSDLGPIPTGWKLSPVYKLGAYINGAAYKAFQPNVERLGLPIIKIAELKAGLTPQTRYSAVLMPEKYRIRNGDVLFSWSGNPDTSIDTFVWLHGEAWLNQHIFRVVPRNPVERSYLLATLKHLRPVFAEIARDKQTTGLGHVTAGDLQRLMVAEPTGPIFSAWDRVAGPILAAKDRNDSESKSLAEVRDLLLPKLLSGEVSVANIKRAVEAA